MKMNNIYNVYFGFFILSFILNCLTFYYLTYIYIQLYIYRYKYVTQYCLQRWTIYLVVDYYILLWQTIARQTIEQYIVMWCWCTNNSYAMFAFYAAMKIEQCLSSTVRSLLTIEHNVCVLLHIALSLCAASHNRTHYVCVLCWVLPYNTMLAFYAASPIPHYAHHHAHCSMCLCVCVYVCVCISS